MVLSKLNIQKLVSQHTRGRYMFQILWVSGLISWLRHDYLHPGFYTWRKALLDLSKLHVPLCTYSLPGCTVCQPKSQASKSVESNLINFSLIIAVPFINVHLDCQPNILPSITANHVCSDSWKTLKSKLTTNGWFLTHNWKPSMPTTGTLCCFLGQDTLLSRCLSPPRCINGYRRNAGGNPAMD